MPGRNPSRSATRRLHGSLLRLREPRLLVDAEDVPGGIGEPRKHLMCMRINFPNEGAVGVHDDLGRLAVPQLERAGTCPTMAGGYGKARSEGSWPCRDHWTGRAKRTHPTRRMRLTGQNGCG